MNVHDITENRTCECLLQWAKIIIVLERTYSHKQLLKFQEEYSVKFGNSLDDNNTARGLMVIRTSLRTKARQRKGAISNWKVSIFNQSIIFKFLC